jgi:hypothetical protein
MRSLLVAVAERRVTTQVQNASRKGVVQRA